MNKLTFACASALVACSATVASATTYEHVAVANVGSSDRNGIADATYRFTDTTDQFSLSFDTSATDGTDGFWFVVNDGPQPYHQGQGNLAIFYSDLTDIWAYQYTGRGVTGVNASFNSPLIQRFENAVTSTNSGDTRSFSMDLDLSTVNSANLTADWIGLAFGSTIGTWLHTTQNTFGSCGVSYTNGDDLSCFSGTNWLGWDEANQIASVVSPVPLPAAGWMLIAALGGIVGMKRRSKS